MELKSKKFTVLVLVFSLMMLSMNLYAEERRGAKLQISKKNGILIAGELIVVKPNSLLLLDTEGNDESVDIADIKVIRVVKKSKVGTGAGLGALIGGGGTALYIAKINEFGPEDEWKAVLFVGAIGATVGLLVGAANGALLAIDKKIHFEGITDLEIREALNKLRKKARIRNYK